MDPCQKVCSENHSLTLYFKRTSFFRKGFSVHDISFHDRDRSSPRSISWPNRCDALHGISSGALVGMGSPSEVSGMTDVLSRGSGLQPLQVGSKWPTNGYNVGVSFINPPPPADFFFFFFWAVFFWVAIVILLICSLLIQILRLLLFCFLCLCHVCLLRLWWSDSASPAWNFWPESGICVLAVWCGSLVWWEGFCLFCMWTLWCFLLIFLLF